MTTALRHNALTDRERRALAELEIPLDRPGLVLEITWDDRWKHVRKQRFGGKPIQWISQWWAVTEHVANPMSRAAMECGPDYEENREEQDGSGDLNDLADHITEVLDDDTLDEDHGLHVEICGWALWAEGLL